jgi:autotransporter-associated beta strand protein
MNGLSNVVVYGGGAIIDTTNYNISILQSLLGGGGGGGLLKLGTGALRLDGYNTYTGPTVVSNGTLGGNGVLSGPVMVSPLGTLSPGSANAIGMLTINNNLTLQGTNIMEVRTDGGVRQQDQVALTGGVTYGGRLQVNNIGTNALAAGDAFQLFSASGYAGAFSSLALPALGSGLAWDTRGLTNNNGTISVFGGVTVGFTNGQLWLSWPTIDGRWVQVQTNSVAVGLSTNWVTVPGSGSTNVLVFPVDPDNGTVFYRVLLP